MKGWLETRQVFDRLATYHAAGLRSALATVVRVNGSAYRHEGAKLIVAEDGTGIGNVSGGCLEADVREVAQRVLHTGVAELRTYCGGTEEVSAWDLGVGCDGEVEILVEPVTTARMAERVAIAEERGYVSLTLLQERRECGEASRMVCVDGIWSGSLGNSHLDSAAQRAVPEWDTDGESFAAAVEGSRLLVDVLRPPPRLIVVSASDDARTLARLAAEIGFRVVVVDRRPGLLTRDRFPEPVRLVDSDAAHLNEHMVLDADACAVVMTHNFADDTAYLAALLRTPAQYLGVLGPRHRTERMLTRLSADGPLDRSRIYGPVGLDIGTDGAEQVAVAVLAELLAVRSGRQPQSLRERTAPIHAGE